MEGLIRIPGGLASNFDTGRGLAMVDLINPADESRGYAEIVALEIAFTQTVPGQDSRVVKRAPRTLQRSPRAGGGRAASECKDKHS